MASIKISKEADAILEKYKKEKGMRKTWLASKCVVENYKRYV